MILLFLCASFDPFMFHDSYWDELILLDTVDEIWEFLCLSLPPSTGESDRHLDDLDRTRITIN